MFKLRVSALSLGIATVLLFSSVQTGAAQKPIWKGTIATENGVKVVRNPAEPLFGTFAFDLQEDLKIGGDPNDAQTYFPKGGTINVDENGNIYIADRGNKRVQMFDPSGKFIRTIGRMGQGPGEYLYPSRILFDPAGNPCVGSGMGFIVYDKNGIFKDKVTLGSFLNMFMIGSDGSIIGTTQPSLSRGNPKFTLLLLDAKGGNPKTLAEYEGELSQVKRAISVHWYSSRVVFSPLTASSFAYGFTGKYEISIADASGRTTLVAVKEESPRPITGKEKDETKKTGVYAVMGSNDYQEGLFFPDHRPFFSWLLNDDKGRLYVVRDKSILEKDTPTAVDVFSKDGIYLYKMIWPAAPTAIKNGAFYELREDKDTGEYTIVRSRIKNWEKMKTGPE